MSSNWNVPPRDHRGSSRLEAGLLEIWTRAVDAVGRRWELLTQARFERGLDSVWPSEREEARRLRAVSAALRRGDRAGVSEGR